MFLENVCSARAIMSYIQINIRIKWAVSVCNNSRLYWKFEELDCVCLF